MLRYGTATYGRSINCNCTDCAQKFTEVMEFVDFMERSRFDAEDEPRMRLGIHLHEGLNMRAGRAALAEAAQVVQASVFRMRQANETVKPHPKPCLGLGYVTARSPSFTE